MDILDFLKSDHKKVSGLLKTLEETTITTPEARADLYNQLEKDLNGHMAVEEKLLYPVLENAKQTHEIALESFEEHKVVKRLLQELKDVEEDQDEWQAKLKVLSENIEHHVKEEEGEMFPKAKKIIPEEERERIADEANLMKQKLADEILEMTRPYKE